VSACLSTLRHIFSDPPPVPSRIDIGPAAYRTDIDADKLTVHFRHDPDSATSYLTDGNLTHRTRLYHSLDPAPLYAGYAARGELIPWNSTWALPEFARFPMAMSSLVADRTNPTYWLFEDSYPVVAVARPTNLIDLKYSCQTSACVQSSCFVGHCIANPDSMCSLPRSAEWIRVDLGARLMVKSVFAATIQVAGDTTDHWYKFSGTKMFITNNPLFRDFGGSSFCFQFTNRSQTGLDQQGNRRYMPVSCEGRYVYLSRTIADSITDIAGNYGDLAFCELDILGYGFPAAGTRFFQVPTRAAGTYEVDVTLTLSGHGGQAITHHILGSEERLDFWDAELYCVDRYQGHLASPNTAVEYAALQRYAQTISTPLMIGLYSNAIDCVELGQSCGSLATCGTAEAHPSMACVVPHDVDSRLLKVPPVLTAIWQFSDGTRPDMQFLAANSQGGLAGSAPSTGCPGTNFYTPHDSSTCVIADWNGDSYGDVLHLKHGRNRLLLSLVTPTGIKLVNTTEYANAVGSPANVNFLNHALENSRSASTGGISYDFNGDNKLDILILNYGEHNELYLGTAPGVFVQHTVGPLVQGVETSVSAVSGDYSGDGNVDIIVMNHGQQNQLFLGSRTAPGLFVEGSNVLGVQKAAFDPAYDSGLELGNWGSKRMAFVCEIDADPNQDRVICVDALPNQVLPFFGVSGGCAEAIATFPCDAVRRRQVNNVYEVRLLSELCPLSCKLCVDSSNTFFNITAIGRRMHLDVKPLPAPVFLSAIFIKSGSTIRLSFDRPTNRARMIHAYDCSQLLVDISPFFGMDPMCLWRDDTTMDILVGEQTEGMAQPGQLVRLRQDVLLTAAENSWSAAGQARLTISSTATPAVAVLSAPQTVGECDVAQIDASASYSSGGRDLSFQWNVTVQPTLDSNNVPMYSCTDGRLLRADVPCIDLVFYATLPVAMRGKSCGELVAGAYSCSADFCTTCTFKHVCDSTCGLCTTHQSVNDTCDTAVALLRTMAYPVLTCGNSLSCVCGAHLHGWRYNLPVDGTIANTCRRTCGVCSDLNVALNQSAAHVRSLLTGPRPSILARDLVVNLSYTFSVDATNFMHASGNYTGNRSFGDGAGIEPKSTAASSLVSKTALPHTQLYIAGPKVLRVHRPQPLDLFAYVTLSSCWYGNTTMVYEWSVSTADPGHSCAALHGSAFVECDGYCVPRTECRVPDLSAYRVAHNTHTTKDLHVVPDSLPAGTTLTFTVRAMIAANRSLLQSTASVTVIVEHSDLVAVIAGGSRSVPTADNFTLDASGSFDPDDRALELRDLQFAWNCVSSSEDTAATGWITNGSCPQSFPFVYSGGGVRNSMCCAQRHDCHGAVLTEGSQCCRRDEYTFCSHAPCISYKAPSPCSYGDRYNRSMATTAPTLRLEGSEFLPGQVLHFSVTASRPIFASSWGPTYASTSANQTGKLSRATAVITVTQARAPIVSIQHKTSAPILKSVSPSSEIVLEGFVDVGVLPSVCSLLDANERLVDCDGSCVTRAMCSAIIGQTPFAKASTRWILTDGKLQQTLQRYTATRNRQPRLTIPGGTLSPGHRYTFRLIAASEFITNLTFGGGMSVVEGYADYSVQVGLLPRCGSVNVYVTAANNLSNSSVLLPHHPHLAPRLVASSSCWNEDTLLKQKTSAHRIFRNVQPQTCDGVFQYVTNALVAAGLDGALACDISLLTNFALDLGGDHTLAFSCPVTCNARQYCQTLQQSNEFLPDGARLALNTGQLYLDVLVVAPRWELLANTDAVPIYTFELSYGRSAPNLTQYSILRRSQSALLHAKLPMGRAVEDFELRISVRVHSTASSMAGRATRCIHVASSQRFPVPTASVQQELQYSMAAVAAQDFDRALQQHDVVTSALLSVAAEDAATCRTIRDELARVITLALSASPLPDSPAISSFLNRLQMLTSVSGNAMPGLPSSMLGLVLDSVATLLSSDVMNRVQNIGFTGVSAAANVLSNVLVHCQGSSDEVSLAKRARSMVEKLANAALQDFHCGTASDKVSISAPMFEHTSVRLCRDTLSAAELVFEDTTAVLLPSISFDWTASHFDVSATAFSFTLSKQGVHYASEHLQFGITRFEETAKSVTCGAISGNDDSPMVECLGSCVPRTSCASPYIAHEVVLPSVHVSLPRRSSRGIVHRSESPRCVSGINDFVAGHPSIVSARAGDIANSTCQLVTASSRTSVCECKHSKANDQVGVIYIGSSCTDIGACSTCNSIPGCGWCQNTRFYDNGLWSGPSCVDGNSISSFYPALCEVADPKSAWAFSSCPCSDYNGCGQCLASEPRGIGNSTATERAKRQCGFCPGTTNDTDKCVEVSDQGQCRGFDSGVGYTANSASCPKPCNGTWAADALQIVLGYDHCNSSYGSCLEYTICNCTEGRWGADCTQVCPGGLNNSCSGRGRCDMNDGICKCEQPWGGPDCSVILVPEPEPLPEPEPEPVPLAQLDLHAKCNRTCRSGKCLASTFACSAGNCTAQSYTCSLPPVSVSAVYPNTSMTVVEHITSSMTAGRLNEFSVSMRDSSGATIAPGNPNVSLIANFVNYTGMPMAGLPIASLDPNACDVLGQLIVCNHTCVPRHTCAANYTRYALSLSILSFGSYTLQFSIISGKDAYPVAVADFFIRIVPAHLDLVSCYIERGSLGSAVEKCSLTPTHYQRSCERNAVTAGAVPLLIHAVDLYGNRITSAHNFTVQVLQITRDHRWHVPIPYLIAVASVRSRTGEYDVQGWLNRTGTYQFTVRHINATNYGRQLIGPAGANPFNIIVDPAALSPSHSVVTGSVEQLVAGGLTSFSVELNDRFGNRYIRPLEGTAALAPLDFAIRSSFKICRDFGGDLWAFMAAKGMVSCPRSAMVIKIQSPGVLSVSYSEQKAGVYYVDLFVNTKRSAVFFIPENLIMSRFFVTVVAAPAHQSCMELIISDSTLKNPPVAESPIVYTVQSRDRFCNPTVLEPLGLVSRAYHSTSSDVQLFPWLGSPTVFSGQSAVANLTHSEQIWTAPSPGATDDGYFRFEYTFTALTTAAGNYSVEATLVDAYGSPLGPVVGSPAVIPGVRRLTAPTIISAQFSTRGTYIRLQFDMATNQARMVGFEKCDAVLDHNTSLSLGHDPRCKWLDDTTMDIYPGTYGVDGRAMLEAGDLLIIEQQSLVNAAENSFPSKGGIIVTNPLTPVLPEVVFNCPSQADSCGSVSVDVSSTLNLGGVFCCLRCMFHA
jgi:hypothetical protein